MPPSDTAPSDAALFAFPDTPERRLRRALRQLDAALEEQRQAVAALRTEMATLSGAVAGLGASAERLQTNLRDAAEETERARAASQDLLARAEAFEATVAR